MSKKRQVVRELTVWFMTVDHKFSRTLRGATRVVVPYDGCVHDILEKINALGLREVKNADHLKVWKLRTPRKSRYIRREGYFKTFKRLKEEEEEEEQEQPEEQEQEQEQEQEEEEERKKKPKRKGKGEAKAETKENEKKGDAAWPLEPDEALSLHFEEHSPLEKLIRVLVRVTTKGTSCSAATT